MLRPMKALSPLVLLPLAAVACEHEEEKPAAFDPATVQYASADVAELEIRSVGADRFKTCPPPGELGQHWIPPLPPWYPSASSAPAPSSSAATTLSGSQPGASPDEDGGAPTFDDGVVQRTENRTATEMAIEATHRDFRSCYRKALVHDPYQDGRVAIVLRIGPDGRTQKVEEYAGCELSNEAISCMKDVASHLRFPPPAGGSDTVTIPVVFTSRDGVRRGSPSANDAYTASAYLTIESARPRFHDCDTQARRNFRPIEATGTFVLGVGRDGRVLNTKVDPWTGEQSLLMCAASVLGSLKFPPPSNGKGVVIARLNFNPRQVTR